MPATLLKKTNKNETNVSLSILLNFPEQFSQINFSEQFSQFSLYFIKKESLVQVFSCEFSEISKNTFFYRTPPVAVSKNRFS